MSLPRTFFEALLLAVLGLLLGLLVNHRLVLAASSGHLTQVPAAQALQSHLPQPVLLDEVRELLRSGALPVDARDTSLYADGHLPGALSLPLGEVETGLPHFRQRVASARTLVIYCNGYGCPDSFDLGMRLLSEGFSDVRVFEGGFPEWRDAGLTVATGAK